MMRCLCAGETRANTVAFSAASSKLFITHLVDIVAEHHGIRVEADLLTHLAGDDVVVTGEDLDSHAVAAKSPNRRRGGLLRWIEERGVALEHELGFVCLPYGAAPRGSTSLLAIASTRNPSAQSRACSFFWSSVCSWSIGCSLPSSSNWVQRGKIASGAPLEIIRSLPSGVRTTTDMIRRSKSNGISSTLVSSGIRACAWVSWWASTAPVEHVL